MQIKTNFSRDYCTTYPLVIGCFKKQRNILKTDFDIELNDILENQKLDFGIVNIINTFNKISAKKIYIIGLGEEKVLTNEELSRIFNKVCKIDEEELQIDLDSFGECKKNAYICTYELNYGTYKFLECKSNQTERNLIIKYIASTNVKEEIEKALIISTAINNARDLINKPYNYLNAEDLASYAYDLVKELDSDKLSIEVYDKEEIEKMKMGAFLAVNKGSYDEPKLICIKYQGIEEWKDAIGLVGKGVMFDSGGYSIKSSMNGMKSDMSGAATVLAVMETLVKNNVLCNVVMVIAATDNRIDGKALLPDDIVSASDGTTIEIVSTDAEGRLTLADALLFAQNKGCNEIIDVATLTGACVVALGEYTTGVFGNNKKNINKFLEYASEENESAWQLPITEDIKEKVKGKVADLTNSTGRLMGASGAAAFLQAFIKDNVDWIHLDIAGTAFHTSPKEYEAYGATGVMVKTIYKYIKER